MEDAIPFKDIPETEITKPTVNVLLDWLMEVITHYLPQRAKRMHVMYVTGRMILHLRECLPTQLNRRNLQLYGILSCHVASQYFNIIETYTGSISICLWLCDYAFTKDQVDPVMKRINYHCEPHMKTWKACVDSLNVVSEKHKELFLCLCAHPDVLRIDPQQLCTFINNPAASKCLPIPYVIPDIAEMITAYDPAHAILRVFFGKRIHATKAKNEQYLCYNKVLHLYNECTNVQNFCNKDKKKEKDCTKPRFFYDRCF